MPSYINIGKNLHINFIGENGATFNLANEQIMSFDSKQVTNMQMSDPIQGNLIYQPNYKGWSGRIDFERTDGQLDEYFNNLEANYFLGGIFIPGTMKTTITTKNPKTVQPIIEQYLYNGLRLVYENAGSFSAEKFVTQTITFTATGRDTLLG